MEKNIFSFIYRHSKKQQLFVLTLTLFSFPFLYFSLELPKIIINEAIGAGIDFPTNVFGVELDQLSYLWWLCGAFLCLVFINGGFKYYINVYRGLLGERMLRRLRYDLYLRVLRFRLPRFKKMSQGEIIPMIVAEVEPLGGFIGDAFSLPAFQGGTLLTYLVFIFVQDPVLGAAAISLYPAAGLYHSEASEKSKPARKAARTNSAPVVGQNRRNRFWGTGNTRPRYKQFSFGRFFRNFWNDLQYPL